MSSQTQAARWRRQVQGGGGNRCTPTSEKQPTLSLAFMVQELLVLVPCEWREVYHAHYSTLLMIEQCIRACMLITATHVFRLRQHNQHQHQNSRQRPRCLSPCSRGGRAQQSHIHTLGRPPPPTGPQPPPSAGPAPSPAPSHDSPP